MSDEGGGGHGAVWLVSYADMVTLLLAFFVVMYTMSQVDAQKLKKLVESMHTAFSPSFGNERGMLRREKLKPGSTGLVVGGGVTPAAGPALNPSRAKRDPQGVSRAEHNLSAVADSVQQIAKQMHLDSQLNAKVSERGVVISLEESAETSGSLVPFESGSAALNASFKQLLDQVGPLLKETANKIEIQGHTDRRPIHTAAYPSNWELSAARAGSVARYLIEAQRLAPQQFVCSGFADTVPLSVEDSAQAWAHNRRIEIVITRQPIAAYDKLTRAEVAQKKVDITAPIGHAVPTKLPNDG